MSSNTSVQHTQNGIAAMVEENYSLAVREFQQALREDPLNYDAYFHLGRVFMMQESYGQAVRTFTRLQRKLKDDPEVSLLLAEAYERQGKLDKAVKALAEAARLAPHREDVALRRARLFIGKGDLGRARKVMKQFVDKHPKSVEGHCELGWVLIKDHKLERARRHFETCLQLAPNHRRAKEGISRIVQQSGGASPSTRDLRELLGDRQGSGGNPLVEATRLLSDGRPRQAVQLLQSYVIENPSEEVMMLLGIAYRDATEYQLAIGQFEELQDTSSDPNMLRYQLAVTYNACRQYERAKAYLEEALAEDPDFAEAYFELGIAYYGLQQFEDARDAYETSIAAEVNDARVFVNLASLLLELGDLNRAGKVAAECLSQHPKTTLAHTILAHISSARQDWRTAAVAARQALRCDPASLVAKKYLAMALCEMGKADEATELLRQLAFRSPDDPMLQKYFREVGEVA